MGLDAFSHVEVLFVMDRVEPANGVQEQPGLATRRHLCPAREEPSQRD
ncbi:MAG: hypothetical protein JWN04_3973, partial [Myxococcaceae bacterium]|nr:hypothetical protein [Myxococcaceae bacterium]